MPLEFSDRFQKDALYEHLVIQCTAVLHLKKSPTELYDIFTLITSGKEVMFSLVSDCPSVCLFIRLSVNRITQKLLIKSL